MISLSIRQGLHQRHIQMIALAGAIGSELTRSVFFYFSSSSPYRSNIATNTSSSSGSIPRLWKSHRSSRAPRSFYGIYVSASFFNFRFNLEKKTPVLISFFLPVVRFVGMLACGPVLSIAEMSALIPLSGGIVRHAELLVDPALAFANG